MRAQVPANTGRTIERLWRHSDAYKYKYKDNCSDRIKSLFGVGFWRYTVFQRKILSLHNPQGNFKKHTEKDSVFAVGSVSQFWTNCNYTGDNVHERLRSAWA